MKLQRQDLQFPFRPTDLLSIRSFVSYCKDHGVETTIDELEFYDQNNKMTPVISIKRDIVEFREIYGSFGSSKRKFWILVDSKKLATYKYEDIKDEIFLGYEDCLVKQKVWLDQSLKTSKAFYPSQKEYATWNLSPVKFSSEPKQLGNNLEYFYSKLQMYLIYFIRNRKIPSGNGAIKTPGGFVLITQLSNKKFTYQIQLQIFFRVFDFINHINNLWQIRQKGINTLINEKIKFFEKGEKFSIVVKANIDQEADKKLETYAKELLEKYKFSTKDLEEWRLFFLGFGTFGLSSKLMGPKKEYVEVLKEEILSAAEDPYRLVSILSWFISLAGGRKITVRDLLLKDKNYVVCPHCNTNYIPRQRNQETCGEKDCVNAQKRAKRKYNRHANGKLADNS